jgi:hypothetical protein
MNEFNPNRNLCMVAAIVTPMTAEQQEWMRLGWIELETGHQLRLF